MNKYSIRKFTVGTGSILIGSLMFLGSTGNVEAAEGDIFTTEAPSTQTPSSETPTTDNTAQTPTTEVPSTETTTTTTEAPSTETTTATKEQPTTESVTTEVPTTVEKATDLTFNTDNTELTGKATAGDTVELIDADGQVQKATVQADGTFKFTNLNIASGQVVEVAVVNAENVKSDVATITANTVEKVDTPTAEAPTTEPPTTETAKDTTSTETVTTEQPTSEASTVQSSTSEASTVQSPTTEAPSTEVTTETPTTNNTVVVPTTQSVEAVANDITTAATEADKTAVLTNYVANNLGVTTEQAQAAVESMNLDVNTLTSDELMAGLLGAIADQQNAGTVVATPVSVTSNTEMMNSMSLAGIDTTTIRTLNGTPTDVNNYVTASGTDLVFKSDATDPNNPTLAGAAETFQFNTHLTVDDAVQAGDYFTIEYGQYITQSDTSPWDSPLAVYSPNGEKIATVTNDYTNRVLTYTFTDYVDRFNGVTIDLSYAQAIDRRTALNDGIYPLTYRVAGEPLVQENVTVNYQDVLQFDN
ncbi:YSIRK-type signal peptide-containing protein, partial [Macrococcus sp. DPC7161]